MMRLTHGKDDGASPLCCKEKQENWERRNIWKYKAANLLLSSVGETGMDREGCQQIIGKLFLFIITLRFHESLLIPAIHLTQSWVEPAQLC